MKKLILVLISSAFLASCSSGGGGTGQAGVPGPEVGSFGAGNVWVSECLRNQGQVYTETIRLSTATTGSIQFDYQQNQDCTGNIYRTQTVQFNYVLNSKNGNTTQATLTVLNQIPVQISITVNGDLMTIVSPNGTVNYHRPVNVTVNPSENGTVQSFDVLALGTWTMRRCVYSREDRAFKKLVIMVNGNGQAVSYSKLYGNDNSCVVLQRETRRDELNYIVYNFNNGAGKVKMDNILYNVTIYRNELTLSSREHGSVVFSKQY